VNANGLDFPLHLDRAGNAAVAPSRAAAVEQLIEQLLFTNFGERLNRPTLGCGLLELVFDPASDELRTATQFQVLSELQAWLGDLIRVQSVTTDADGSQLRVTVTYSALAGGPTRTAVYER
jgi:phage baseplate assembly protein W